MSAPDHNPHKWKETLADYAGIALVILAIGGCCAMGGGIKIKMDDSPAAQEVKP